MGDTSIEWTDKTWNPVRGCSRVSEGCRNCYAESVAARFSGAGMAYEGLVKIKRIQGGVTPPGPRATWNGVVRLVREHLTDPLRWRKPQRVFVNSMSDLFHESLSNEQIAAVFGVMAAAPQHTFQVLTKRAKRMREWFVWMQTVRSSDESIPLICWEYAKDEIRETGAPIDSSVWNRDMLYTDPPTPWPLPNVWLGVSVENQDAADERIPELLETPAAMRFLSCEPLLGPVDISEYFDPCSVPCGEEPWPELDWVIVGCESGNGARVCDVAWIRALRDQCDAACVALFLKQAEESTDLGEDGLLEAIDDATIAFGEGSKLKRRRPGGNRIVALPYLDGVQHADFPK